jgi:hypothetical protein
VGAVVGAVVDEGTVVGGTTLVGEAAVVGMSRAVGKGAVAGGTAATLVMAGASENAVWEADGETLATPHPETVTTKALTSKTDNHRRVRMKPCTTRFS